MERETGEGDGEGKKDKEGEEEGRGYVDKAWRAQGATRTEKVTHNNPSLSTGMQRAHPPTALPPLLPKQEGMQAWAQGQRLSLSKGTQGEAG